MANQRGLRILKITWCILCFLAACLPAGGQTPVRFDSVAPIAPDSADIQLHQQKHFWRASAEVVGFNTLLWSFDRFVQRGHFAYISFKSIRANFRHGFKWDNDALGTNTFLHPYNGNLYFNAARTNGYNFWQSGVFAVAGSALWELFMECEYPSTNDIIATPIGGAALGEMFYRTSDLLIDDSSSGAERIGREAAAFILNPMRGFNRLITGQMWRRRASSGRRFGMPPFAFRLSAGFKALRTYGRWPAMASGAAIELELEYGSRFEPEQSKPYDYFSLALDLNVIKTQPFLSRLQLAGRLLGRTVLHTHANSISAGLYQHFDFFDSDTISRITDRVPYKLGMPASVGGGVQWRNERLPGCTFDAYLHANGILLGGILSDYYRVKERNYNWASGFSLQWGLSAALWNERLLLSATHDFYRLFTWQGYRCGVEMLLRDPRTLNVQGDRSVASFNVFSFRGSMMLRRHLYATLGLHLFRRTTRYCDYPRVLSDALSVRAMLTYKF